MKRTLLAALLILSPGISPAESSATKPNIVFADGRSAAGAPQKNDVGMSLDKSSGRKKKKGK